MDGPKAHVKLTCDLAEATAFFHQSPQFVPVNFLAWPLISWMAASGRPWAVSQVAEVVPQQLSDSVLHRVCAITVVAGLHATGGGGLRDAWAIPFNVLGRGT